MKILFITLEQSGRQIVKSILDDNFFKNNKNHIFTFGMDDEYLEFNDLTNIKLNPIMGFVDIVYNLKYLFNLRVKIKEIVDITGLPGILIDSYHQSVTSSKSIILRIVCTQSKTPCTISN